jgi:serine/threonine protein kinase
LSPSLRFIFYSELSEIAFFQQGQFGNVYKGFWHGQSIVIKVPRHKPGRDEWSELLTLLDLPSHPNVLPFIGICRDFKGLKFGAFCLVSLLQQGSLKKLLSHHHVYPSRLDLIRMGIEMARGLQHLHSYGIIHRDIALRNYLLSFGAKVLISDFGMSFFFSSFLLVRSSYLCTLSVLYQV